MPARTHSTGAIAALAAVAVEVDRTPVLRGLDFTLAAGECLGVVGPNGSGKSTLLRVLATLLAPVSGQGHVLGARLGSPECATIRRHIELIGHDDALYRRLTLRENLRFVARLTGRSRATADRALDAVGLAGASDRTAQQCSQGMRRRAELARVLLTRPRLLLLDEAHAGLDPSALSLVEAVVDQVRSGGGACVLVSHDHPRLTSAADRVIALADGRARQEVTT